MALKIAEIQKSEPVTVEQFVHVLNDTIMVKLLPVKELRAIYPADSDESDHDTNLERLAKLFVATLTDEDGTVMTFEQAQLMHELHPQRVINEIGHAIMKAQQGGDLSGET